MPFTPICPHTLNTRSMILSADDIITIEMCPDRNGKEEVRLVSFDGDNSMKVFVKDKIEIKKSEQYTEIIQLKAVEPVGVEMIIPSAEYKFKNSPFTYTLKSITRKEPLLLFYFKAACKKSWNDLSLYESVRCST